MVSLELEALFYRRLTQLRANKKVSARYMSLCLGQNENYINNIENGRNFPSMEGFFYICEYLGIHPKDFFDENAQNPAVSQTLLSKIQDLNDKKAIHIIAIIDDLLEK